MEQVRSSLQEEDKESIAAEVQSDSNLLQLIHDSREAYGQGSTMTTAELIKSMSVNDYANAILLSKSF